MKKRWKATFIIELEGEEHDRTMTSQIARDKLLVPIQEMWILRHIKRFSIEEIEPGETKSFLARGNEKGVRESFYKTGFPLKKRKRVQKSGK